MSKVTHQQAFNAVKYYDSYFKKNRSNLHLSSFSHAIQEVVEDYNVSDPNFYHMYLVCENIIQKGSTRSVESIVKYCKYELSRDIHFWQYNPTTINFSK